MEYSTNTSNILKEQKQGIFVLLTVNLYIKRTKSAIFVLLKGI